MSAVYEWARGKRFSNPYPEPPRIRKSEVTEAKYKRFKPLKVNKTLITLSFIMLKMSIL